MEGKKMEDIKGITEVIKLQAENSDFYVILIATWEREYAFIYETENEAQKVYETACGLMVGERYGF